MFVFDEEGLGTRVITFNRAMLGLAMAEILTQYAQKHPDPEDVPYVIISLQRGGDPLGLELSKHFDVPLISVRPNDNQLSKLVDLIGYIGRHILVVDDITDSGDTLQRVMQSIPEHEDSPVEIAVLVLKITSSFHPTYVGFGHGGDEWVHFYWEVDADTGSVEDYEKLSDVKPTYKEL